MKMSRMWFVVPAFYLRVLSCLVMGLVLGCDQSAHDSSRVAPPPSVSDSGNDRPDHVLDSRGPDGTAVDDPRPTIVAFGDSLTAGLGVGPAATYPALLQETLDTAGYRFRVINAGASGDTTAGGVRRVEWVLKSRPRIVIVEFGGNDGLRGLDIQQTRANLDEIISRFQAAGVTVVLAGMQLPPNYGKDYTAQFARLYPELARVHRLTLIPFFLEGVATHPPLNQADGIHPTEAGYRIITGTVMKYLGPVVAAESRRASRRTAAEKS